MGYKVVEFDKVRIRLETEIEQQKNLNQYDARSYDPEVLSNLNVLVKDAVAVENDVHNKINSKHQTAKKVMDEMETLVKKQGKKLTKDDLARIGTMVHTIEQCSREADKSSTEAVPALLQWRASWPTQWTPLVSDPKRIDRFAAQRKSALDWAPSDLALRRRMGEYVKRAKDIEKLAKQTESKGASLLGQEQAEITKFQQDAKKCATECTRAHTSASTQLTQFLNANKATKKRPDAATLKDYDELLVTVEKLAKTSRGAVKTFEIKLTTFKKTAGQFDSAHRKLAEKAYNDAAKDLKTATTNAKALAADQAKGAKLLAALKKLK